MPILDSKDVPAISQKKVQKKGKIFENLGKNLQNLKMFWKGAASCLPLSHVWNSYNMPWSVKFTESNLFLIKMNQLYTIEN